MIRGRGNRHFRGIMVITWERNGTPNLLVQRHTAVLSLAKDTVNRVLASKVDFMSSRAQKIQ